MRPRVRQIRARRKISRRRNPAAGRTRLLRHADPRRVGRRGRRYDQLRADARGSGARGRRRWPWRSASPIRWSPGRSGGMAPTRKRRKYLPQLARGEILGSFCLTEPQAGFRCRGIQTRAMRDGDVYVLNGMKSWVTNGGQSGLYIVFAKTDPAGWRSRGVTAFLVEPSLLRLSHQPLRG